MDLFKKSELPKEISKTQDSTDKTGQLKKEKNEVISKIRDLEKNYSSGDLLDEEYEELRRPLEEKVNKIDEELKRLSEGDSEDVAPINNEDKKEDYTKSSTWSTVILFLLSGIVGAFVVVFFGYVVTKVLKFIFPNTKWVGFNNIDFTNYGWRGWSVIVFGVTILMFGFTFSLLYSGELFQNDIISDIKGIVGMIVVNGIFLIFCRAGIKQFEPP